MLAIFKKKVTRLLGVDIGAMTSDFAEQAGIPFTPGVYVDNAYQDGSAAKAGIKQGDIITKINGKNVTTIPELREMVGRSKIGETINVTIVRDGREKDISVRLYTRKNG